MIELNKEKLESVHPQLSRIIDTFSTGIEYYYSKQTGTYNIAIQFKDGSDITLYLSKDGNSVEKTYIIQTDGVSQKLEDHKFTKEEIDFLYRNSYQGMSGEIKRESTMKKEGIDLLDFLNDTILVMNNNDDSFSIEFTHNGYFNIVIRNSDDNLIDTILVDSPITVLHYIHQYNFVDVEVFDKRVPRGITISEFFQDIVDKYEGTMKKIKEEKKDYSIDKMLKDIQSDFSGSNEEQMGGVQLLKGFALSEDPLSNEFMKELDKAITEIAKKLLDKKKKEDYEKNIKLQVLRDVKKRNKK